MALERCRWNLLHFPKTYSLDAKPPKVVFLNSNSDESELGETLSGMRAEKARKYRHCGAGVKFGKEKKLTDLLVAEVPHSGEQHG